MLKQRIITALILFLVVLVGLFYLDVYWFAVASALMMLLASWEWSKFMTIKSIAFRLFYVALTASLMISIWYHATPFQFWPKSDWPFFFSWRLPYVTLLLGCLWWLFAIILVFTYPKPTNLLSKSNVIIAFIGMMVVLSTWVGFVTIREIGYIYDPLNGAYILLYLFAIIWATDIGAYFVGRTFGRRKLAKLISPKKTWEGLYGGVFAGIATACIGALILGVELSQWPILLPLMLMMIILAVYGDLVESMFKRQRGMKDSGSILPGHGGILDRIDSICATIPVFALSMHHLDLF